MDINKVIELIGRGMPPSFDVVTIIVYGSSMYKDLEDTRDIDACVIISNNDMLSGRMDVYIPIADNTFKRASVYVVTEKDLYSDIYTQKFGGRWSILFFHGYICSLNYQKCIQYYIDSMNAVIHQYNLHFCESPHDFFILNNIQICKQFPYYIKSSLDFFNNKTLQSINYRLFCSFVPHYKKQSDSFQTNNNRLSDYLETERFFRNMSLNTIRGSQSKLDSVIDVITNNQSLLCEYYSMNDYNSLLFEVDEFKKRTVEFENTLHSKQSNILQYYGKIYIDRIM